MGLRIPRRNRRFRKKCYFSLGENDDFSRKSIFLGRDYEKVVPSSHYYLGSVSWTSRTFYFPDSRDLLEVLGDLLGRERERDPREDPLGSGRIPWGPPPLSLCRESLREPREGPENLGSTILSDQLASLSTGLGAQSRLLEAKSRGFRSLEAWKNLGLF